ncbi:MAG: zinc carboxypeptidase [Flavobacteriaceae bacterium CG18_big_fil_WC_8_21_14_2_50_34_36]|nr:MAG: zinc carboxypeptidase [Flavobacteriaceae bacterium CG18_big_fil_WC_8_21_14_2_50_34_36]PJC07777.1 MAG: zinc carboxypeptidase [Flavobacteriaceae bacterium CG_4_9_14_0_8_um_filter_34_30]
MKKNIFLLLLISSFFCIAQNKPLDLSYYLPQDVSYNKHIPTPKSVIGHEVGEWHITHDKLVQYMQALANSSNRITIENRGVTIEGRPLILLTITSPKNHENIENIRLKHLSLSDADGAGLDLSNMPIVINQGFSIHGNEPSGSNAALAVAYYLAAAQGTKIDEILDNTIILFDPSFNPDGLQRFSTWVNMHKSENINPDPNDREYRESWPGARTNHYWFDMNRDWLPSQLPESRVRIKTFHQWYPNILTDHHEMGTNATFFFQPGIPSRTHPLTPKKNQSLTGDIAQFHANALDQIGSFYYSEEDYDDFYYGKGSTFPDIQGSIGILFEQASSRGHAQESDNGILTFPFTIRNQFVTALSTLEAGVKLREKILSYQRQFFQNARKEAKTTAIVFGDEKDAAKAYHLAEILQQHKIKIYEIKDNFTLNDKNYKKGYSYMVPTNQKQTRLIQAIFEKRTTFEDSLFYDISAWSFPLAFNVDYNENAPLNQLGSEITSIKPPVVSDFSTSNYAYLMEWHEYYTPKALNQILEADITAKVGLKPFEMDGKKFDYGTILIPVQNQKMTPQELAQFLTKVAHESFTTITSVSTGRTNGMDLGSNNFKTLKKPKVALLVGDGITPSDAGEIWHLFDQRYAMKITKLDTRNVSRTDVSRYTHLILPNSWGNALDKNDTEKIKTWIKNGGIFIGYKNAAKWATSNELVKLTFKEVKDTATNISFEKRNDYRGAKGIGGAIFETKLDRSHPVNFGYKNSTLPLFKNSTLFLEPDVQSYNNPILFTENPLLSGYITKDNLKNLANSSAFKVENFGSGKVLLFLENTNFRAFWFGTNKLLMNAIFFGDFM